MRLAADESELLTIAVDPKWRGKRLGHALLKAAFDDLLMSPAKKLFLEVAADARSKLQAEGIPTAVVSMPCWELFEAQDAAYQSAVLGEGCVRVGVEAAMRFGWDAWLGPRGGFIGMKGFGASGPVDALFERFGITAAHIVADVKRRL